MYTDTLDYQHLSGELGESRCYGRRGGIAKRGEGSPCIKPTCHENEAEVSYFQDKTLYEDDQDDQDDQEHEFDAYPPSPPLSPKTTALPRAQTRQRKRGHLRHRTSLKRRSSWNPNLKQEFLRRGSIDSIIVPFNETVWESDRRVPSMRRRSSVTTTGASSESPRSNVDRRKARKQSTLLHPSSPDIQSATSVDPFYAASAFNGVHGRDQSTAYPTQRSVMLSRKGSSLLHPSRPASEVFDYPELKTVFSLPPKLL
jgi:hypothetical protein